MKKRIHLISNAHLDPVWQWEWQEGVGAAISTFSAACDFCEEFDDYVFCHNESILYEWIEKFDKPLFKRIKKQVELGKWHIMGGWYLQPDCNMLSGESFVRQILKGTTYFENKFPNYKQPTTAINFDSFGHTRGLVQILNDAGYDSYIVTRPASNDEEKNMIWKGFNNSEVIVTRVSDGYNSFLGQVDKKLIPFIEKSTDIKNELFLWGIGNHGGGPTRLDYKMINDLIEKHPEIEFVHSTPERYFNDVKKYKHELKETEDLNPVNVGCYTSQIRIKQLHAHLENDLFSAEKMASHASLNGMKYPSDLIKRAEEDLLFSQFHDILPGSSIKVAEDTALRQLSRGIEEASKVKLESFFTLVQGSKRAEKGEYPVFAYNPHPYPVKTIIESEFMLQDQNRSTTHFYDIEVYHDGKLIPSQIEKEDSNLPIDWRKKVIFEVELRPFTMERFSCFAVSKPVEPIQHLKKYNFNNGLLAVNINPNTGLVDSLKINGEEFLESPISFNLVNNSCDPWGFFYDNYKEPLGSFELMSKDDVKDFSDVKNEDDRVRVIEDGPVRTVVQSFLSYKKSQMVVNYVIPKQGRDFKIDVTLYNLEKDIKLKLHVQTTLRNEKYYGKTAFGVNELLANGNEQPALNYIYLTDKDKVAAIINFGNHGSDSLDGALNQTLVNSSAYCAHPIDDREILQDYRYNNRIDMGERSFSFVLLLGYVTDVVDTLDYKSTTLSSKPYVMSFFPTGNGKKHKEFFEMDNKKVILSAYKPAYDGKGDIIRIYNSTTAIQTVTLNFKHLNIKETLSLNGYEFKTLRLYNNEVILNNCLEKKLLPNKK